MRRLVALLASATLTTAIVTPVVAEPYVIDRSHAYISFMVDHLGFAMTHGTFREFDAQINFNPDDIEAATVAFTIEAASVETFWEARDTHVRSADFLDVETYPQITFVSNEVRLTSEDTAEVTGDVTMRGVTRPETFEVKLNRFGPHPFNKDLTVAGFTITGVLDRRNYGSTFGAPAIGAEIPIRIDLEASPRAQVGG